MKHLRQYIKNILKEAYVTTRHPKLDTLIHRFFDHPDELKIVVDYDGMFASDDKEIISVELHSSKTAEWGDWGPIYNELSMVGQMQIIPYEAHTCVSSPYVVTGYSEMDEEYNLGPLLYDVAIELAGHNGLMADRRSVNDDAFAMWKKYLNLRDDIQFEQLDDEEDPWTSELYDDCDLLVSRDKFDDIYNFNPKYWDWDEEIKKKYKKWARYSYDDPLSKVFYKENTEVLDVLKAYGGIIIKR